jgi:hypothetical protein
MLTKPGRTSMADPRIGAMKERPPLRGTADGAMGPLEGAGASHESPKAWEERLGS